MKAWLVLLVVSGCYAAPTRYVRSYANTPRGRAEKCMDEARYQLSCCETQAGNAQAAWAIADFGAGLQGRPGGGVQASRDQQQDCEGTYLRAADRCSFYLTVEADGEAPE